MQSLVLHSHSDFIHTWHFVFIYLSMRGWVIGEVMESCEDFFLEANKSILLDSGTLDRCGKAVNGKFDASKYGIRKQSSQCIKR